MFHFLYLGNPIWHHPQNFDIDCHTTHKNDERTKVFIITENENETKATIQKFKSDANHNRARWEYFVIEKKEGGGHNYNIDDLVKKIRDFQASDIILDFPHGNKPYDRLANPMLGPFNYPKKGPTVGALTNELIQEGLFAKTHPLSDKTIYFYDCIHQELHELNPNFMFLKTFNLWDRKTNGAILMSGLVTNGRGWHDELLHLRGKGEIPEEGPFKILVLSGTHGGKYNGGYYISGEFNTAHSGFTVEGYDERSDKYVPGAPKGLLEEDFFKEDEKSAEKLRPRLTFKENSERDIKVLNMEDFNKQLCEKKNPPENHRQKLLKAVEDEKPDLLILAWCFSTNGDVCMALRSNAELSRMIVQGEMRKIGIKDAEIDSDQFKVLEKAQDPDIKDIILTGGTGSGKTIIGAEVVKIWMAQHENEASVRTPCFYLNLICIF